MRRSMGKRTSAYLNNLEDRARQEDERHALRVRIEGPPVHWCCIHGRQVFVSS